MQGLLCHKAILSMRYLACANFSIRGPYSSAASVWYATFFVVLSALGVMLHDRRSEIAWWAALLWYRRIKLNPYHLSLIGDRDTVLCVCTLGFHQSPMSQCLSASRRIVNSVVPNIVLWSYQSTMSHSKQRILDDSTAKSVKPSEATTLSHSFAV